LLSSPFSYNWFMTFVLPNPVVIFGWLPTILSISVSRVLKSLTLIVDFSFFSLWFCHFLLQVFCILLLSAGMNSLLYHLMEELTLEMTLFILDHIICSEMSSYNLPGLIWLLEWYFFLKYFLYSFPLLLSLR
jgi:hypothetical protein